MGKAALQTSEAPETPIGVLVSQARCGDAAAEAALCGRFVAMVRTFAHRRLRGDAADEFVQDVMLLFIEAIRSDALLDPERAGGFLLGVCRNLARDRARLAERRAELWAQFGSTVESYEPAQTATYEVAHLEDCLSQLSARSRDLIRWSFVEVLGDERIASELATSEGNVRVMRHRTLHALRDCMSGSVSWELG